MTKFPFKCSKCDKVHYQSKMNSKVKCCEGAKVNALAIVCHLVPCPTGQTPIHTSKVLDGVVDHNREWVIGCGKTKLPTYHTDQLLAVTCKECLDAADQNLKNSGSSLEEYNQNLAESLGEAQESTESQENPTIDSDTEVVVKSEESETPESP